MDGWDFVSILYKHSVVGLYTYFKYTKLGVAMGCDATFKKT